MNIRGTLVNLYKEIVMVTRLRIFCKTLFTNNNKKNLNPNPGLSALSL
jgi:hypothetical protein